MDPRCRGLALAVCGVLSSAVLCETFGGLSGLLAPQARGQRRVCESVSGRDLLLTKRPCEGEGQDEGRQPCSQRPEICLRCVGCGLSASMSHVGMGGWMVRVLPYRMVLVDVCI